MSWIKARRRHPAAGYAVVLAGLVVIGLGYAAIAGTGGPAYAAPRGGPSALDIAEVPCALKPWQDEQVWENSAAPSAMSSADGPPRGAA